METYPSVVRLSCDLSHRRAKIIGSRRLEEFPPIPCWLPAEQLVINPGH
jgi:hypothetical protein